MSIGKHYKYFKYLTRHKYFVFKAGLSLGVPIHRLVIHDWSKFTPFEWIAYVHNFYDKQPRSKVVKEEFNRAFLHHIHHNKHHWQYWVLRLEYGEPKILRIPPMYAREMVADWMGAGRAITGKWDIEEWYRKYKDDMVLHPETRILVENLIFVNLTTSLASMN